MGVKWAVHIKVSDSNVFLRRYLSQENDVYVQCTVKSLHLTTSLKVLVSSLVATLRPNR